ncbi:unnamed protein product, partial [Scytosiphon promiscuus]
MYTASQPASPLPRLNNNDDSSPQHLPQQRSQIDSCVVYEGFAPASTNRLFEAKSVNLVPRPRTSTSFHRSSSASSPPTSGLYVLQSPPPSASRLDGNQLAPRHDNDIVRPSACSTCRVDHHQEQQEQLIGGESGNAPSDIPWADGRGSSRQMTSSPVTAAATAVAVPRWPSSRERLSNSVSTPSGVGLAYLERMISTSPEQNHNRTNQNSYDRGRWGEGSDGARNGASPTFVTRSDSLGSPSSQGRTRTNNSLRRSASASGEAFSSEDCGSRGGNSRRKHSGPSVAASADPAVLKAEIRRLQAALMNEFKGGNRFVGGAQFKSSSVSRKGHVGGMGGHSCGGCLQVREALRRSRVECRDLRGSLFRAEDVIKQLTLTKAARRRGAHSNSTSAQQDGVSSSAATAAAANSTGGETRRGLVSNLLCSGSGGVSGGEGGGTSLSSRNGSGLGTPDSKESDAMDAGSRVSLLARVQQLERELRLADFRNARTLGAAVKADHTRSRNCVGETVNKSRSKHNDDDSDQSPSRSRPKSRPSSTSTAGRASSHSGSAGVRDREDPLPCSKCCTLDDRLLREATKVNGLMRQVQEHQQESKRLREELVRAHSTRTQIIEAQEKLDAFTKLAEGHARANVKIEAEIERLVTNLDRGKAEAKEQEGQMRRASEQHAALQEEVSTKDSALERAATESDGLRAALGAQKVSREQAERTAGALRKKVSEERAAFMQTRGELAAATAARRHAESQQASAADAAHRKTLKAALNSCVRLCVVAPTVNINLDDRSRSFCSGLPEEKIRTFVEESVLPRFTRVLLQPGSERGSGVPMTTSLPSDNSAGGR